MGIEAGNYRSPSRYFLRKLHQYISEFPWVLSGKSSLVHDYPENRPHKPAATSNWLGLVFFYAALVAIVHYTLKWYKRNDEIGDDNDDECRSTRHHAQSISSIEPDTNDQQLPKQKCSRKEAGDSASTPRTVDSSNDYQAFLDFVESINLTNSMNSLNHESNKNDPSGKISLNRIKNQRKSHHPQRSKLADKDWYVRRTRSGQVYGRYPVY